MAIVRVALGRPLKRAKNALRPQLMARVLRCVDVLRAGRAARAFERALPTFGRPGGSGANDRRRAAGRGRPTKYLLVRGAQKLVQRSLGTRLFVDALDDHGAVERVLAVLRRQVARD